MVADGCRPHTVFLMLRNEELPEDSTLGAILLAVAAARQTQTFLSAT